MTQGAVVILSPEDVIRLTMIVTDKDMDDALVFLREMERKIRMERDSLWGLKEWLQNVFPF